MKVGGICTSKSIPTQCIWYIYFANAKNKSSSIPMITVKTSRAWEMDANAVEDASWDFHPLPSPQSLERHEDEVPVRGKAQGPQIKSTYKMRPGKWSYVTLGSF